MRGALGSGADGVPLAERVRASVAVRLSFSAVLLTLAGVEGALRLPGDLILALGYLGVTTVLGLGVLTRRRSLAVRGLGIALLVDAVYLQYLDVRLSGAVAVDIAMAAFLVSVCLLASFRTGLKLAVWTSLLDLIVLRATESGLLVAAGAPATTQELVTDLALTWLLVLTTSTAAAVSERELRRRRYDAEALQQFAAHLHNVERPAGVLAQTVSFLVRELDATRVVVCRPGPDGLEFLAGHGTTAVDGGVPRVSALLRDTAPAAEPSLALRVDPAQDPWLDSLLPHARRLIAFRLDDRTADTADGDTPDAGAPGGLTTGVLFVVLEHGAQRGSRVEQRMVATARQAVSTASLAYSRARLLERASIAAVTDGLTGVLNRRAFDAALDDLVAGHLRTGVPAGLVMVDVDHFKSINDTYGHQVGDRVLQKVARCLADHEGGGVRVARYGGEEFSVLLPGHDVAEAAALAERMRVALTGLGGLVPVTASFGVACLPEHAAEATRVVERADSALMAAKAQGRNRVVVADRRLPPTTTVPHQGGQAQEPQAPRHR